MKANSTIHVKNKYFPDFIGVIKPCLGVNKVNDQDISCFTLFIIYQFSHGKKNLVFTYMNV